MGSYWCRHRLLISILLITIVAIVTGLLFVFPYIDQKADRYNSQSIYLNTEMDFIAPEPSFDQIRELEGTNGIKSVFPFFMTKIQVNTNHSSRTTTILLSEQFNNLDMTMYNGKRLIKKSDIEYEKPAWVDWQFCHDTSTDIGDTISFVMNGQNVEYKIYAIYETNCIYDGGAILVGLSEAEKALIIDNSKSNGYSGMYVAAFDYAKCRSYLTTDYRPLGRLKAREQFDSDEQYKVHYDAVMSAGYANEITDFRVRENNLDDNNSISITLIGAAFAVILFVAYSIVMVLRGCEKAYFSKQCVPKGIKVKSYYVISFFFESILFLAVYFVALIWKIVYSASYIPRSILGAELLVIPVSVMVTEVIMLIINSNRFSPVKVKSQTSAIQEGKTNSTNDEETNANKQS